MTEDVSEMADYNWSKAIWSFLVEAIEETKVKIPIKKNLQMHGFAMILQAWFYEHTNLYAHPDEKGMPRNTSWVNLYIGHKYNIAQLISSIKDNQIVHVLEVWELERREATVKAFIDSDDFNAYMEDAQDIISIEGRLRRTREALQIAKKALRLEKEAHNAMKKELEQMRALLVGRGRGDKDDDSQGLCPKLHDADVARAEDVEVSESLGQGMSHEGRNEMDDSAYDTTENVVLRLKCDIQLPSNIAEEGEMHDAGEGSKSSIAKRIRRSPRLQHPSAKQISPYINPGKWRIANVYTSRKRSRKAIAHTSKQQHEEEIGVTRVEVEQVTTRGVAIVPAPTAVQGEKWQGDDEDAGETNIGAEATTAAESTPTVEGCIDNISMLVGASQSSDEPRIVGNIDNKPNDDAANPPIHDVPICPSQDVDKDKFEEWDVTAPVHLKARHEQFRVRTVSYTILHQ
ncbi:hypothetical protein Cgig2_013519 [Carnegiea gigantea]|uniref:Uncharacterized protein n=1 Tax=Carnegiea gigantea TaxID=171969 RepID=A0A9Q1GMK0_9CARY|nr:hypothetical protein Cgig2_013519 [Carnegiea gigantea]